ncbi:hypothetical protein Bca4012_027720 [Brassica carinata]
MAEETANIDAKPSKAKDIRHYLCQYCGISRSKKYLITSHINSHHKLEVEMERDDEACEVDEEEVSGKHACHECGAEFKKPAHLKQHMQSHSLERPFGCYVDDCTSSYRRKDHLNRHLLTHKGKLFKCPMENCKSEFSVHGNISRHVKKFHSNGENNDDSITGDSKKEGSGNGDSQPSECSTGQKKLVCKEKGCGKAFKYPSQLQKHQDSHVKLDSVEAFCSEPGCMKYFTNEECLKAHIRSCHRHINCEICGSKHLKKNIKRHLRTHDEDSPPGELKCEVEGCSSTFSKGDFVEADEDFTSRPRGGVKRKHVTAEMLIRKRVMPPQSDSSRSCPWSCYNKDGGRLSSILLASRVHDMSFLWGREASSQMQLLSCS